ncbi:MAG: hypothetical protein ACOCTU_07010 [Bacteroidota bacterium]
MKKFSDFADNRQLEGDKINIDEVLNKEVIIKNYNVKESKFNIGDKFYMTLQVEIQGVNYVIFTSSVVLRNQLEKYREELPFIASLIKINNYYTLS